jgi:hypothetical protein
VKRPCQCREISIFSGCSYKFHVMTPNSAFLSKFLICCSVDMLAHTHIFPNYLTASPICIQHIQFSRSSLSHLPSCSTIVKFRTWCSLARFFLSKNARDPVKWWEQYREISVSSECSYEFHVMTPIFCEMTKILCQMIRFALRCL